MFEQSIEDFAVGQTYSSGCHNGSFLGVPPTGKKIHFETLDAMRVKNGKIAEHWGVANIFSLMQQISTAAPSSQCLLCC